MGSETLDELPFLLSGRLLPYTHGEPLLPPIYRYSGLPKHRQNRQRRRDAQLF